MCAGFIHDILFMSNLKPYILQLTEQLTDFADEGKPKKPLEKSSFMPLTVKYLGHEIGFNWNKSIQSKIFAIQKILSPTTKFELMRSIGSMNFSSKFIDKFYV